MSSSRESASLWYVLFNKHGSVKSFIKFKGWTNPHFIQDTFQTPFNKFIGCKLFGHRDVKDVSDPGEDEVVCFNCYKKVDRKYLKVVN